MGLNMSEAAPTEQSAPILQRSDADGVTTLTLNRPSKFNSLSVELLTELQQALDAIARDESVHVVIIAGNGKAFCTGHDLKQMRADSSRETSEKLFRQCSEMMLSITRLPQPVIAKVHGVATAAGCQLVATCDLAVSAEGVKFATSGVNLGLFCSTPMVAISRNMPRKAAMDLLLTGDFIDAQAALDYGLLNHVVAADELDDFVDQLARKIASKSPTAIAMGKQLFYRQMEAAMSAAFDMASETMACNMTSEDAREGIDAFLQKAPMPAWRPRKT